MASLAGISIKYSYDGLLKTTDNDDLTSHTSSSVSSITDGIGTVSALYIGRDRIGIGEDSPNVKLEITETSTQLELSYNDTHKTAFYTHSDGTLLITPSGNRVKLSKDLTLLTNVIENSNSLDCITLTADQDVAITRYLQVIGNKILASNGADTIELTTAGNVKIANNLRLGNNIIQASNDATAITVSTSGNVTVANDLHIAGNTITVAGCLLYSSQSQRDGLLTRMPSTA